MAHGLDRVGRDDIAFPRQPIFFATRARDSLVAKGFVGNAELALCATLSAHEELPGD